MKALTIISTLLALPVCIAQAADKAGAMEGYFPTDGTLQRGAHVRPVYSEALQKPVEVINQSLPKLSAEERATFIQEFAAEQLPSYNRAIWPSRDEYDKFVEAWKKTQIRNVTEVAVGLQKLEDGTWRVLSATVDAKTRQQRPLTISALRYDAEKNEWISNNGVLTAKDYTAPDTSIYGAQTGTEWSLEKNDSLVKLRETLRVSRTTDGKYIYLAYSLVEVSAVTGNSIAQGTYLLRFPVQVAGANLGAPGQR